MGHGARFSWCIPVVVIFLGAFGCEPKSLEVFDLSAGLHPVDCSLILFEISGIVFVPDLA